MKPTSPSPSFLTLQSSSGREILVNILQVGLVTAREGYDDQSTVWVGGQRFFVRLPYEQLVRLLGG